MAKRGPEPSPEEILEAIDVAPADDEMDRILAMTPEERRAELEAAGVDLADTNAKADALHARWVGAAIARRRRSVAVWLAAAACVALIVAAGVTEGPAVVAWIKGGSEEPIGPDNTPPRPPSPREVAEKDRDEADKACFAQEWAVCLNKLDEARKLDPAGEAENRVQRMREEIGDALDVPPTPKHKR